jgi:hypothetical protein
VNFIKVKISATFHGKCDLCNEESDVVRFGDEDTKKVVTICRQCSKTITETRPDELIVKYGKLDDKPFEQGVKIEGKGVAG